MKPFTDISAVSVNTIKDDIFRVISKRKVEYEEPDGKVYLDEEILCALEIVRAAVTADLVLTEHSNRWR